MSVAFLLTTLVVLATPGTGAVYSIAAGLSRGSRAGIIAAFGCTLGVLPHMVAAITCSTSPGRLCGTSPRSRSRATAPPCRSGGSSVPRY